MRLLTLLTGTTAAFVLAACAAGGGREVTVTATDSACTPNGVDAQPGEKLTLVVKNEAKGDREIEGIEGARLPEVLIPAGRTRRVNFTMPEQGGTQKVKCYIPGGPSTIIELRASGGSPVQSATATVAEQSGGAAAGTTVDVKLVEWRVTPSVSEVPAGRVRFVARNVSASMVHELAVLSVGADGQKREIADVEGIRPGGGGELVVELKPGRYELACLIAPGEAGSTADHYQEGMHTPFVVR